MCSLPICHSSHVSLSFSLVAASLLVDSCLHVFLNSLLSSCNTDMTNTIQDSEAAWSRDPRGVLKVLLSKSTRHRTESPAPTWEMYIEVAQKLRNVKLWNWSQCPKSIQYILSELSMFGLCTDLLIRDSLNQFMSLLTFLMDFLYLITGLFR